MAEKLKLAAILAADFVGYSRPTGKHEGTERAGRRAVAVSLPIRASAAGRYRDA
jgi:hypothetical protein